MPRAAPDVSDAGDPRGQGRRRKAFGYGDTLRRCVTVILVATDRGRRALPGFVAVTDSASRVAVG
jgi:hypothetical protein